MKKTIAIIMIMMLLLTGCGKDDKETTTVAPETTTNVVEETTTETSIDIVNQYGFINEEPYKGASELEFQLIEGTVKDCGDYYQVEAEFLEGIKVPVDMELGDEITVTIDGISGETDVWVYEEDGFVSQNTDNEPAYIMPGEGETETYAYRYSDDRVNRVVYRGPLCIAKDAEVEIVVAETDGEVTKKDLDGEFYHKLFFDANGFVTKMMYTGD